MGQLKQMDRVIHAANIKGKKVVSNLDKEASAASWADTANCVSSSNATALLDSNVGDRAVGMNKGHYVAAELPFAYASASQLDPWQCQCLDMYSLCFNHDNSDYVS